MRKLQISRLNGQGGTSATLEQLCKISTGLSTGLSTELNPKDLKVAWAEPIVTVNPVAISQAGLDLARFTFFECAGDIEWVALEVLHSALFPILVLVTDKPLSHLFLEHLRTNVNHAHFIFIVDSSPSPYFAKRPLQGASGTHASFASGQF